MKMILAVLVVMLSLLLGACRPALPTPSQAPPSPTPAPSAAPSPTVLPTIHGAQIIVQVDPSLLLQVLHTVSGGNFIHNYSQMKAPLDPVSSYNLDHLPMQQARVRISLEEWEPENDNVEPQNINWPAFKDEGNNHLAFLLMQELQKRGIQIVATVWDIPAWMTPASTAKTNKFIPYNMYPEVVESIAAWLKYAQDKYAVNVAYISFNEPNVGVNVSLSAREYIQMIKTAAPRLAGLGLSTRWLLGDTSNFVGSVFYASTIWSEESIRPYLGPLAVHSWDSGVKDATLQDIAAFAQQAGLEVWCSEAGWDPFLYTRPDEFPTWNNAIRLAAVYSRMLKLARVSVILYWEMMGNDYWLNDGTKTFPSFAVLEQLGQHLPKGSQVVWTSPDAGGVYSFAAFGGGNFVLYLVNNNPQPAVVQVNGLPGGSYTHLQSTEQEIGKIVGTMQAGSEPALVTLPASSFNLFFSQAKP